MDLNTTQKLWRTDFDDQWKPDMIRDLIKAATSLTKRYERYTPRRSTDTSEDRVHAALVKLFAGTRTWNPKRVNLFGFVLGVVASDLTSELRRSKAAPIAALDASAAPREDDYTGEVCEEPSRTSIESGIVVPFVAENFDEAWWIAIADLRTRAGDDANVLALLGAYEEGAYQKRDVMKLLGWKSGTYKRAYARLVALADACDPAVREAIIYTFAN